MAYPESQGMNPPSYALWDMSVWWLIVMLACTAYSRYCLDIGTSEDWFALQVSLIPCLLGYGMIGERLKAEREENPPKGEKFYQTWIDNYTSEEYRASMDTGRGRLILG